MRRRSQHCRAGRRESPTWVSLLPKVDLGVNYFPACCPTLEPSSFTRTFREGAVLFCVCEQERDIGDSPLLSQVQRASMVIRALLLSGNALGHKDTTETRPLGLRPHEPQEQRKTSPDGGPPRPQCPRPPLPPCPLGIFSILPPQSKRQNHSDGISLFSSSVKTTAIHNCQ